LRPSWRSPIVRVHHASELLCSTVMIRPAAFLTLLSATLVLAQVYYARVEKPQLSARQQRHDEIIAGNAASPYRYRVLMPFAAEAVARVLNRAGVVRDAAVRWAYRLCDVMSIWLLLVSLFVWLSIWFTNEQSLVGALFVAATMPMALQDHDLQPWSVTEAALFTAALISIAHHRYSWLAILTLLAALNRETAVFVPLALLLVQTDWRRLRFAEGRRTFVLLVVLVAIWATTFLGLRAVRGSAEPAVSLRWLFSWNRDSESLHRMLTNWSLFLGAFWLFAALGVERAPATVRRLLWLVPPYLVTVAVWGVWFEVRLLMSLYPILLPLALAFLYDYADLPGGSHPLENGSG
jgi:hypothetical protein